MAMADSMLVPVACSIPCAYLVLSTLLLQAAKKAKKEKKEKKEKKKKADSDDSD